MMSGVRGCTARGLVVWHGASACLNQLNSVFAFHLLVLCPLPGSDPRPEAYICPAYKSPLPQLLLPTSATQGGIPLPLSSCCLYPYSMSMPLWFLASITVAPYAKDSQLVGLNAYTGSCERQPVLWSAFLGLAGLWVHVYAGCPSLAPLPTAHCLSRRSVG